MISLRLLACTLAILSACPATAAEDRDFGPEAVRVMHEYGACVASNPRFKSEKILSVAPGSEAEKRLVSEIATSSCLDRDGALAFKSRLLRGAVSEALFEDDFGSIGAAPKRKPVTPFSSLSAADISEVTEIGRQTLAGLEFASCVVMAAPAETVALLATKPTTAQENEAFARLSPHLGPCLQTGAKLTIVKPQLRGFLAEAAYRAAFAATVGSN